MKNPTANLVEDRLPLGIPAVVRSVGASARRYRSIGLGLAASDIAAICLALTVAYWMRYEVRPLPARELLLVAAAPVVWVLVFHAFSLYSLRSACTACCICHLLRNFGAPSVPPASASCCW